jgi:general secretion pathway protein A
MYIDFFKLKQNPFSIAPDPRFLFMSDRHREALAHLLYGVSGGGGFVLLTGEVGAGKTTVCRCFLEQIPENCHVGYIFNPKLTALEMLKTVCDEFHIEASGDAVSTKTYVDALNRFLLQAHAGGKHCVLIIDEAQSLSAEVLEQLRLLTNLETNERKLLQIILIGQPELRDLLAKPELRQLAQRVIARYHLDSLSPTETARYVQHRLAVAGIAATSPLPTSLMKQVHGLTLGVPRRINLLCDRALLGAYAEGKAAVTRKILTKAASEVFGAPDQPAPLMRWRFPLFIALGGVTIAAATAVTVMNLPQTQSKHSAASPTVSPSMRPAQVTPAPVKPITTTLDTATPLDLDQPLPAVASDASRAYRELAKQWGQTVTDGDACQLLQQAALRCYVSNKGFAEIRQLDRPVLLNLHDTSRQPAYALLTSLSDTQANLTMDGKRYVVSLLALSQHFQGDFVTLWKVPEDFRERVRHGDQGKDIDWLATQLAKLNDKQAPAANAPFEQELERQVKEFQSAQGLQADGLVGPKTLMQLNRAIGSNEPRLHNMLAAAADTPRK